MGEIILHGFAASTFVRSTRLILEEKNVPYHLEPVELSSSIHRQLHPWGRIPVLQQGDFVLYETSAILRYLEETYPEPSFLPDTARGRARMEQWISVVNGYLDRTINRSYIIERFAPVFLERPSDEAKIAAALPEIDRQLDLLDQGLAGQAYLAGDAVSLADLMIVPTVYYLARLPDSREMVTGRARLQAWLQALEARPAMAATAPEVPVLIAA